MSSYKKSRHLHQQVREGGKYANKPLPPLVIDQDSARAAGGGIQISTGARKLLDVLCMMLDEQSARGLDGKKDYLGLNTATASADYMAGNMEYSTGAGGVKIEHRVPVISATAYELARYYMGGREPDGRTMQHVRGWVDELAKTNHRIRYDRKEGGQVVGTVDVYLPIIHAAIKRDTESGEAYVLQLNPIFRDQIANQFILLPDDYAARLAAAFNGKPTRAAMGLIDYILLQISFSKGPRYSFNLGFLKAAEIMGIPEKKVSRQFLRVREDIAKALGVAHRLGLIDSPPEVYGAKIKTGRYKFDDIGVKLEGPTRWFV